MATSSPPPLVCVTGGGGFTGSWLVKLLLSRGQRPTEYAATTHGSHVDDTAHSLLSFCIVFILHVTRRMRPDAAGRSPYEPAAEAFVGWDWEGVFHACRYSGSRTYKIVDPQASAFVFEIPVEEG